MKRVTILKVLIGVIALCQSSVAMSSQVNNKNKVDMFINTKWIAVYSIDKISADAIKLLVSKFHDKDHRLANVAGPYNHSDFMDDRPRRRLILAGNYGKYWFIYYELGGIASTNILVLMDLNLVSNKILFTANGMAGMQDQLGIWKTGIADINKALKNNTMLINENKEQYY